MKFRYYAAITAALSIMLLSGCQERTNGAGNASQNTFSSEESASGESTTSSESESSGYASLSVTFPASEVGKTEYNSQTFDVDPFTVTAEFPEDVTLIPSEEPVYFIGNSPILMKSGDETIGWVAFFPFESDGIDEKEDWSIRAIYNQIMLGADNNWNGNYTPVEKHEGFCAATTEIMTEDEDPSAYHHGILAYSIPRGVYIMMYFNDVNIDKSVLEHIAGSIEFSTP